MGRQPFPHTYVPRQPQDIGLPMCNHAHMYTMILRHGLSIDIPTKQPQPLFAWKAKNELKLIKITFFNLFKRHFDTSPFFEEDLYTGCP
ncbi:hypothetical protein AVEN_81492-1 [Araneus ventricosus]|uniref:Uncharacterized protein n=1 Tax=Araneus ventricosus TaxID=182803 RepID=A0A4Y2E3X1_ARAVE|nr:hypothetical protein AVEN_81492-1 [Araneus ventricosus]